MCQGADRELYREFRPAYLNRLPEIGSGDCQFRPADGFQCGRKTGQPRFGGGKGATTVVNHLIYDAFGRLTSETNPAIDSLFLFTGRPFDSDTQLQNNLNRWYDARVGRWLSEDPIGFNGEDGNVYRYTSNPLVTTDSFGLEETRAQPLAVYGVPAGWVGWELTLAGRTLIRIGDEEFYVTGKPQPGMWVPKTGSTSALLIYRKSHPDGVFRLDYHPLPSTAGRPVWHYNTVRKLAKVKGLTRGTFASTNHAVTAGSRVTGQLITIFRYGGAALFVVGGGISGYEIYRAENRAREAVR